MQLSWPGRRLAQLSAIALSLAFAIFIAPIPAMPAPATNDAREHVTLTATERARLLEGMRAYLLAIQEIVEAASAYKLDRVRQAARRAGSAMLAEVEPATALKLPLAFTALSLETHQRFDDLAESTKKQPSRSQVLVALGEIIARCNGCHESYRLVTAP